MYFSFLWENDWSPEENEGCLQRKNVFSEFFTDT